MATEARPLKNKRLSDSNRNSLYNLARKRIVETQDSTELDNAYEFAADAVHNALVEKYPQKDMKVLARYDAASPDGCVYVSCGGYYEYDQFCFRSDDKRIPLRPSGRGCNSRNAFMLEGEAADAFRAYKKANEARDEAIKQRFADFKALIYAAKTFNEVTEVWPEAEQLREAIVGTSSALVVLSNDVVERIKADPAYALAEAA
jgi:hypothetical protein